MTEAQIIVGIVGTWLSPIVAVVIIALGPKFAIHMGWRQAASAPQEVLNSIWLEFKEHDQKAQQQLIGHLREINDTLTRLEATMGTLKEQGEARTEDGEVLIHQRMPRVQAAAAHPADG